jgi:hypothetical protein
LFGEVGSSTDVLNHEPFLERARLQREQEHDGSARLALGAYVLARLIDRMLSLELEPEALQGFRWQLEAVRRHVKELPAAAPETAHLTGVVEAVSADGKLSPAVWMSLTAYAYFLEHEGRLEESLEMLVLAARAQGEATRPSDFISYALFAGRLNRMLARWDTATSCYLAGVQAAQETGDVVAMLRGRLGCSGVDRGRGNLPLARATAEAVAAEAASLGLRDVEAMAYGDLGAVYGLLGLRLEALKAQYRAFQLAEDPELRLRMLGDVAFGLRELGALEAARIAFSIVTESTSSLLLRANAHLELMDIHSAVGNRVAFERYRTLAEKCREKMSPSMSVDFGYKLGTGLARFGQISRAREALNSALSMAEAHGLNTWYFKVEQALEELNQNPEHQLATQAAPASDAPDLREMEAELREYAEAALP